MLTVSSVAATRPHRLEVQLSDGESLQVDLSELIARSPAYAALRDPDVFCSVVVDDWGHGVDWPSLDQGLAIETLIRLTREQTGKAMPTEAFNAWLQRHRLTLTAAAEALGLSRSSVVRYHTGQRPIPIYVGLACEGWEARKRHAAA